MLMIAGVSRAGMTVVYPAAGSSPGWPACRPAPWSAGRPASRTPKKPPAACTASRCAACTSRPRTGWPRAGSASCSSGFRLMRRPTCCWKAWRRRWSRTRRADEHLNTSKRLFAGFTFIGQFIDHDITFDHTPLALQAGGSRWDGQLPNAALRPRLRLRARARLRPAVLRPGRPGQASGEAERQWRPRHAA